MHTLFSWPTQVLKITFFKLLLFVGKWFDRRRQALKYGPHVTARASTRIIVDNQIVYWTARQSSIESKVLKQPLGVLYTAAHIRILVPLCGVSILTQSRWLCAPDKIPCQRLNSNVGLISSPLLRTVYTRVCKPLGLFGDLVFWIRTSISDDKICLCNMCVYG